MAKGFQRCQLAYVGALLAIGAWGALPGYVRADTDAIRAEMSQETQERAALANTYNTQFSAMEKNYESAMQERATTGSSASFDALEDQKNLLVEKFSADSAALSKSQKDRINAKHTHTDPLILAALRKALKAGVKLGSLGLSIDDLLGHKTAPGPTPTAAVAVAPVVVLDGSAVPKELEFKGASAQSAQAAPAPKTLREQVLEEVRAKLGLTPIAPTH